MKPYSLPLAWLTAVALLSGCSLQRLAVDRVGDALAAGGTAYGRDDDVELVGAATPFALKLTESLLVESPGHRGLLLAAARGFTQYAYAYVELPADEAEAHDGAAADTARQRARRLYLRARDYGLRGLAVTHPGFVHFADEPEAALDEFDRADVALLYWTAAAWAAAIALGRDDPVLLAGLPQVERLVDRALVLDEAWGEGALQVLAGGLAMVRPGAAGQRAAAARRHFERAMELAGNRQAAPFVVYAESVALPAGRRDEFTRLLDAALRVDVAAAPDVRLANAVFQRRARWLLGQAEQFFPD
ncbi:TRAP transporter TatT component family protein [Pseudogulbenkiania sp. MAI-1]|uniref:TRAP transporter TatT component family protein n=1 Tax=Pseudogulbenkiania sp. MAI-1 TaxID=990370 RepID=UPI00045E856D|nr:TRAP transporter TatT component family protein [Pseudogulbenkiania sp. MAI-1]